MWELGLVVVDAPVVVVDVLALDVLDAPVVRVVVLVAVAQGQLIDQIQGGTCLLAWAHVDAGVDTLTLTRRLTLSLNFNVDGGSGTPGAVVDRLGLEDHRTLASC